VATRPFPASHRVPGCESEAYVWTEELPDHTLKYYFAVENPQGISAKATAVILDKVLSGAPLQEVLQIPPEIIYQIFGQELSMGKNLGLTNMLIMCQAAARKYLASMTPVLSNGSS
jgi:cysteine desulfuration protein SufE